MGRLNSFKVFGFWLASGISMFSGASALAAVSAVTISSDSTSVNVQYSYTDSPKFHRLYLDTDQRSSTGYQVGNIGADFLIENQILYRHSGIAGSWSWASVRSVSMVKTSRTVKWTVARSDLGSPASFNLVAQYSNPASASKAISYTLISQPKPVIALAVQGAPNLPLNGTSTQVSIQMVAGGVPLKVELSRDGYAPFAVWPGGNFFQASSDGKTLTGNWCISSSCWGGVGGAHVLNAVATYSDGSRSTASVSLNVADAMPQPQPEPQPAPAPAPAPAPIVGPTYYLSPSGNDANPGTQSAPWRTIQKAANTVVAGDTVVLMNGSYEEPSINFRRSGTAAKPITFRAQNKWQAVLSSTSGCNPGFSISASYITVKDIRFAISPRNQNCATYTSANTHIRAWNQFEATPSNPSTGYVGFKADGIKTEGGLIRSDGVKSNQDFTIIENSEADSDLELFNCKDCIIRNNHVIGQNKYGISILAKGGVRNAQIYNNVVRNKAANGYGIYLGGFSCDACHYDTVSKVEAYNSVAYNNIIINEGGTLEALIFQGAKDSAFFNNVVIGGNVSMTPGGHNTGIQAPTENPILLNNIVICKSGTSALTGTSSGTRVIDNNNFSNCSGVPSQAHPIVGSPMFVNQANDFHLQAGSPAINAGVPVTVRGFEGQILNVSKDKNGVTRTAPWDLGVYEQ